MDNIVGEDVTKRFQRTGLLFGSDTLKRFNSTHIAIAGLGGVGSAIAEMLARSGIGAFTIVDFDIVSYTDINRQLIAHNDSIGKKKTEILAERIKLINPAVTIRDFDCFCDISNRESIFSGVHFIVDAIDSLGPKAGLLEFAYLNKIPMISCMGAGNRLDPGGISISDISIANGCPLLKRVKKYLRKRNITTGIPVVYSQEQPIIPEERIVNNSFRGRDRETIGSVAYMPIIIAGWAVSYILKAISKGEIVRF